MGVLDAVILGIVEGVTEFLPISSTGHLMLTAHALALPTTEFLKTFEIVIQLGAILAVVVLYWRTLLFSRRVFWRVAAAFVPTALVGLLLYPFIKEVLLGSNLVVLWALALGGLALIVFELWHTEPEEAVVAVEKMTYRQAVTIGLFQSLAVVPGVSRAAATIVGGLVMGLRRQAIVEFSFLLAVPTMLAASGLDLLETGGGFSSGQFGLLGIGFLISFVVALGVVRWLLRFIQSHTFIGFGAYRIALAVLFALFLLK
ncbi:MAG: undecaprenyl-diphosphatase UppP [Candidatus Harrisonbacteria bacterium CG10_big_fil_rev_8_21_14_0_10_49_15]|uniref:Undecaprenyl-diphosphatase n=1 Tax=Candidatus Harrisonbacteria bacterium CG10_big_fil_rev_8_21_14_0_10_49_15 TaxID=1974587 RepID=A0A2H0UL43_9BACT|nr:MAG: undecaprenyl-diphosphatase UppP [Candidatus Harrisonbacteria bacterium CG10_big_fil_rev_8_21_14_0_10_49_15]